MAPQTLRAPAAEAQAIATFLAHEDVKRGARILDVPCGIGRRALALAEEGFEVTAVDPNEIGIQAARARVPETVASRLRLASTPRETIPGLATDERFDAILCLDHALGRGSREQDVAFLSRLVHHATERGILVVDFLHRDYFALRLRPFSFHVLGTIEQHEFRSFDPLTGVLELTWKFYERSGQDLRHRMDSSVRLSLLTPHGARELLETAGWRVHGVFGGWEREPVSAERRKLILVTRPAARG